MRSALAVGVLLALLAGGEAVAYVTVKKDPRHARTVFRLDFTHVCSNFEYDNYGECEESAEITVRWRDGKLRDFYLVADSASDWRDSVTMDWSCKRRGFHRFSVSFESHYGYDDDFEPDHRGTKRGRWWQGRCGPWRPWLVGRGSAATLAARQREDHYVSRSRCSPTGHTRKGRSNVWRCAVTWHESFRECTAIYRVYFKQRKRFGYPQRERRTSKPRNRHCSYN